MTDFLPAPEPGPAPAASPAGLVCAACGNEAWVHWLRRLTDDELAAHIALEQGKRDERLLLADPQLPPPDFGPLPQPEECTRPVFACGAHAIEQAAAVLVHTKDCTAPNVEHLPGCDCTPEPPPKPVPAEDPAPPRLPEHWIT